MKIWMMATIATALALPGFAQTQPAPPGEQKPTIAARKKAQQKRIAQGVKSGELTPGETAKIERKEGQINREVARERAKNGGNLTSRQKAQVNRQQNRVSREIAREKHDAQTQPPKP